MNSDIWLIEPDVSYAEAFCSIVREYEVAKEEVYYELYKPALEDFPRYVQSLVDLRNGVGIPEGWVPGSTFWLTDTTRQILGVIRVRHIPLPIPGHIGYDVPPSKRGRGYGSQILALGLEKARALNLDRVYICCDDTNLASAKIIEKNGGIFLEMLSEDGVLYRKYYIDL